MALLAWVLLGERPSNRVLAAMPVVLAGVVLISGVIGTGAYGSNPLLGVITGVVTGDRVRRLPADPAPRERRPAPSGGSAPGRHLGRGPGRHRHRACRWARSTWSRPGRATATCFSWRSARRSIGWLFISVSLPRLPAALTSVILTIQPVGAVLLGILLVNEHPSPVQLAWRRHDPRGPDARHPATPGERGADRRAGARIARYRVTRMAAGTLLLTGTGRLCVAQATPADGARRPSRRGRCSYATGASPGSATPGRFRTSPCPTRSRTWEARS